MLSISFLSGSVWNVFTKAHNSSSLSLVGQAIEKGKYKNALKLIQDGAVFPIIESDGSSNLRKSVSLCLGRKVNIDLINALLSRSDVKTINYCEKIYSPALNQASYAGYAEVVNLLVAKGADVNAPGQYELTPLMHAVMGYFPSKKKKRIQKIFEGQLETAKVLIFQGANVHAKYDEGLTPLEIHVEEEIRRNYYSINQKLISYLIEYGADPSRIVTQPSRTLTPSQEILKKIKSAVQKGLIRRKLRVDEIKSALDNKLPIPGLIPLILTFESERVSTK